MARPGSQALRSAAADDGDACGAIHSSHAVVQTSVRLTDPPRAAGRGLVPVLFSLLLYTILSTKYERTRNFYILNVAPAASGGNAHARLRGLIVSGRIAPGTRLVELELARRLAVSRTPVREAIAGSRTRLASVVGTGARTEFAAAAVTRADLADLFAIIALGGSPAASPASSSRAVRRETGAELAARNAEFARLARRSGPGEEFFAAH